MNNDPSNFRDKLTGISRIGLFTIAALMGGYAVGGLLQIDDMLDGEQVKPSGLPISEFTNNIIDYDSDPDGYGGWELVVGISANIAIAASVGGSAMPEFKNGDI